MHGAAPGGPMYLVEEAGYVNGGAARDRDPDQRVEQQPDLRRHRHRGGPVRVPGPGRPAGFPVVVATNDTTFSHAEWRVVNGQGMLVSSQNVGLPDDGFSTSKVAGTSSTPTARRAWSSRGPSTPAPASAPTSAPSPSTSTATSASATWSRRPASTCPCTSRAAAPPTRLGRSAPARTSPRASAPACTSAAPATTAASASTRRRGHFLGLQRVHGHQPCLQHAHRVLHDPSSHDEDWYSFAASAGEEPPGHGHPAGLRRRRPSSLTPCRRSSNCSTPPATWWPAARPR